MDRAVVIPIPDTWPYRVFYRHSTGSTCVASGSRNLSQRPNTVRAVLQRRPLIIEPGGLEGEGFESGLLKIGIEGGGSLIS